MRQFAEVGGAAHPDLRIESPVTASSGISRIPPEPGMSSYSERITGECNRRFRREAQSKALFGSGSSDTSRGPLQQGGSLRPQNLRLGSLASTASACQPYLACAAERNRKAA